jgi:tRNA 2-selenouridine synthase
MAGALSRISKKLGGVRYQEMLQMLENWDVTGLSRGLIEHYYDKLILQTPPMGAAFELDLEDYAAAEQELKSCWLNYKQNM